MEAVGMIILIVIVYFVITIVDKYAKEACSVLIGSGVGCTVVILEFAIGIGALVLIVTVIKSCGG